MDPRWGGPCRLLRDSTPELLRLGIRVEVLCADPPGAEWLGEQFPCHGTGPGKFGYAFTPALLQWIDARLLEFDAVVVDTLWQWHGLAAMIAQGKLSKRHHPSAIPGLFVMPHGGLDPWYQRDQSRRWKSMRNTLYWWAVERHLINSADAVVYTARDEAKASRTTFRGYAPNRELIVTLGVPLPPPCSAAIVDDFRNTFLQNRAEKRYLLYLNRVHPKKGTDLLMHAYADAKRAARDVRHFPRLVIAGPGLETSFGRHVCRLVTDLDLNDDVTFTGMLHGDQKWAAIYGCDAFVLCSHQENFGISIVEALACDRPVLITNKVNIWREIEADGGGLVCEQDRSAFANLMQQWVRAGKSAGELTPKMCYEKNFGIEQHAKVFASTIKTVLDERAKATLP
jgi:glycosyltransferase involved in cell wall biosynthesis